MKKGFLVPQTICLLFTISDFTEETKATAWAFCRILFLLSSSLP